MTDFNQKTHDTDVGSHGGQSRQMMEVFENQEFGSIRVLQEAGKTFFCASDVAKALGYVNPYAAVKRHCRGPLAKAGRNALYRISSSRKRETNFCGCSFPKKWRTEVRESLQSRRARFYRSTKIRFSLILPLRESCWGVPSPNPAYAACAA